jgi:signal transduction histidine kinase
MSVTLVENAEGAHPLVAREAEDELNGAASAVGFEELLGELSTTFVRITADKIDSEIKRWLRRIVLALDFDRSTVAEINSTDGILIATHQWAREGVMPTPARMDVAAILPWLTSRIFADEVVALSRVEDAPPEAARDLEFARLMGNKSFLAIPLKVGGAVVGVVTFGSIRAEKTWNDRGVRRMRLVADVFGNALERKRAVAEIRRFEEEMHQISRVAMMGELTVSLAHELNQPLGAILNNAQAARRMLMSDPPDLKETCSALDDIVRDNSRAVEIVAQVRALFQRSETQNTQVDLRQVLLDIESLLRHEAMVKGISLRLATPDSLPSLVGQRTQLMQLLLNLVLNAFDAVCESPSERREVEIRASDDGAGHIRVAVRDSGKGIDPSNMARLFDAFFTTKEKGIGLGLAIARSIVEKHGGRLWAVPNPDHGASLEFELPAQGGTPEAS